MEVVRHGYVLVLQVCMAMTDEYKILHQNTKHAEQKTRGTKEEGDVATIVATN